MSLESLHAYENYPAKCCWVHPNLRCGEKRDSDSEESVEISKLEIEIAHRDAEAKVQQARPFFQKRVYRCFGLRIWQVALVYSLLLALFIAFLALNVYFAGEINRQMKTLEDLKSELETANIELENANVALEKETQKVKAKENELHTKQEKLDQKESELQQRNDDLKRHNEELATARLELETTRSELATTRADLATTRADLATTRADLATTQADLATIQPELAATQLQLTATETQLRATETKLRETESQLKAKQEDNDRLTTTNEHLDEVTSTHEIRLRESQTIIHKMQAMIQECCYMVILFILLHGSGNVATCISWVKIRAETVAGFLKFWT